MTPFQIASDFIERAEKATGLVELRRHMADAFENLGVPHFSAVGMIAERAGEARAPVTLLRWTDDEWANHYWDAKRYNIDPVVHTALKRFTDFTWRELEDGRLSKPVRNLFGEVREAMHIDGSLVIPTHDEEGFAGLVALYHEDAEVTTEARGALKLIALFGVERAKELYLIERGLSGALGGACPLTPRQREILSHVADGKSDWHIGQLLTLAQTTVNEHIENAKKSLGVKTRCQAVAIAIRRGWIVL